MVLTFPRAHGHSQLICNSAYYSCYVHRGDLLLTLRHSCRLDRQPNISFPLPHNNEISLAGSLAQSPHLQMNQGSDTISVVVSVKDLHISDSVISLKCSESSSLGSARANGRFLFVETSYRFH